MPPSPPEFETLRVEADGRVGRLTLDQPERLNPLGSLALAEIIEAARWFDHTEATVVVITGAGRSFSAGFDLAEFGGGPARSDPQDLVPTGPRDRTDLGRRMADAVESMRAVTIASIHGPCVGGGFVLVASCDLRVASDDTRFSIPEVDLGIPLTWGAIPRMVRDIPAPIVRELVLTCRQFDAHEAKSFGFVNRVVAVADLADEVTALAASLAGKAPSVLRATKRQINEALDQMATTGGAWAEADMLDAALRDPEARAAAQRYIESKVGRAGPQA